MAVLPGDLPQAFFEAFVGPIHQAPPHPSWRFLQSSFPYVALHVLDTKGQPILGLLLDATDWPHRPPRATPCSVDFRRRFGVKECAPFLHKEPGENHIYDNPLKLPGVGAYFCVEGTREFHEDYGDAMPWESVRHLGNFTPVAIVNNVVALIKRP